MRLPTPPWAEELLRRTAVPPTPHAERIVEQREHLTLKQLAEYSGFSTRWLLDRTKDINDPLPASRPKGGKITVRRTDYDNWLARRQETRSRSVGDVVDDVIAKIGRG